MEVDHALNAWFGGRSAKWDLVVSITFPELYYPTFDCTGLIHKTDLSKAVSVT